MSTFKEVFKSTIHRKYIEGDINNDALYKLWTTGEVFDTKNSNGLELFYIGLYYQFIKKDSELAKKYLEMSIEKGNTDALIYLAYIFKNDTALSMRYLEIGVEKGNTDAMIMLGYWYINNNNDYESAKKYWEMAVEAGCTEAMHKLGYVYYYGYKKDIESAKRYWEMGVERGCERGLGKLLKQYWYNEKNYEAAILLVYKLDKIPNWISYWNKIVKDNLSITNGLVEHLTVVNEEHLNKLPVTIQMIAKLAKEHIDTLDLHFQYAPGQSGYEIAKSDFLGRITTF